MKLEQCGTSTRMVSPAVSRENNNTRTVDAFNTTIKHIYHLTSALITMIIKFRRLEHFPCLPAPAHLIQMSGSSSAFCRALEGKKLKG